MPSLEPIPISASWRCEFSVANRPVLNTVPVRAAQGIAYCGTRLGIDLRSRAWHLPKLAGVLVLPPLASGERRVLLTTDAPAGSPLVLLTPPQATFYRPRLLAQILATGTRGMVDILEGCKVLHSKDSSPFPSHSCAASPASYDSQRGCVKRSC